eukprot:304553-Pelagomonas_calceolata.AAC.1
MLNGRGTTKRKRFAGGRGQGRSQPARGQPALEQPGPPPPTIQPGSIARPLASAEASAAVAES